MPVHEKGSEEVCKTTGAVSLRFSNKVLAMALIPWTHKIVEDQVMGKQVGSVCCGLC